MKYLFHRYKFYFLQVDHRCQWEEPNQVQVLFFLLLYIENFLNRNIFNLHELLQLLLVFQGMLLRLLVGNNINERKQSLAGVAPLDVLQNGCSFNHKIYRKTSRRCPDTLALQFYTDKRTPSLFFPLKSGKLFGRAVSQKTSA